MLEIFVNGERGDGGVRLNRVEIGVDDSLRIFLGLVLRLIGFYYFLN